MKAKKLISRIVLIAAILLILAIIVFCWPRRIDRFLGKQEITSMIATTRVTSISHGTANSDSWQIDHDHATAEITSELEKIMSSCRYTLTLRTLVQPNNFELKGNRSVYLILTLDDGSFLTVDYLGDDLVLLRPWNTLFNIVLRPLDQNVCTLLSDYIIEVGQKS